MTKTADMENREAIPIGSLAYWTARRIAGGIELRYAVRGGAMHAGLTAVGVAIIVGCLRAIGGILVTWFQPGGGVLVGGVIAVLFLLGVMTFGVYILDCMLIAATFYRLLSDRLIVESRSLFGGGTQAIRKDAITEVFQQYSPPDSSAPQSSPGTWVTFVRHRDDKKKERELPLTGLNTPDEARWFGPLLAKWSGTQIKRNFAASFEEADPAELPEL